MAILSFVPFVGVPISLVFIVIGFLNFRSGGKRLALLGLAGIISTLILSLLFVAYLVKDMPSIHDRAKPFCEGENAHIQGDYLSFDQIPSVTLDMLEEAEPNILPGVARVLVSRAHNKAGGQFLWHLRGVAMLLWLRQYKQSDLTTYYLNRNYFGSGCYGISAAAKFYFNKDTKSLTLEENAKLFAMIKSYFYYSIIEQPERNRERAVILMKKVLEKKDKK